ncbi:D-alanyl-D-alanine carboxypeptidase [Streptomyces naganishii JCM 4654]|uniref:serine-type D-Ala-D-Ala carboxypeptidase n=1 Tax=Streptomyces naganishii JCM 4654 TaxID=1306179 RepID=A0A918Y650_9ACTN|nr:D-alanyl-D-alanine carboxypeptidase [Streptomyces naganishii JCM 4654]
MAGESPDRSKQRESSAEPTSGSAGPVPEARGESREVRDPRLALSGEARESREGREARESGGVDTATRVLSVRDLVADEDADAAGESGDAPEAPRTGEPADAGKAGKAEEGGEAGKAEESGEAEESGDDGDEKNGSDGEADRVGDARLRAAVAAWARSGDGETKEGASEDAPSDDTSPEDASTGTENPENTEPAESDEPSEPSADAEPAEDAAGKDAPESAEPEDTPQASEDEPEDTPKAAEPKGDAPGDSGNSEASDGAEAPEDAESAEPGEKPKPAVDQPTTMLKLGGTAKPKPPVDQPTTMLKIGGDPKSAKGEQSDKAEKGGKAETDAERTSRFIALKPLDAPDTRKPQPKTASAPAPAPAPDKPGTAPAAKPRPAPADATAAVPQVGPERTTQQPLPPKPPLDLLAELTNTPPPPETPLRTAVRRVKIWTPLVLLLVIVFAIVQAVRPLPAPSLALTAKDSYTFDGSKVNLPWPSEGQGWMDGVGIGTMDHFGKQTPVAIGSVAKTMTAYIVLKDHPLKPGEDGPKIKVDATAEKEGGYNKAGESTLDTVKAGDFLTEKQALSAIMVPSANNIARLLARWDAGSEAAFVRKMNDTARELGMTGTTYTDPSGLKETTVSTAQDQVKLGNAVVKIPALVAITSAASWKDPYGHTWGNYNQLPYLIGAIGIKTGTTTAAGGNLLFAARKKVGGQTVTVVGAILGQHKPAIIETVNAVSKTALLAAENALTSAKILKKGDVVGYVDDQLGGHTPVVVTKDVPAVGWAGLEVKLSFAADRLPHTAKAGTKVGTLTVGDGAAGAVQVPVALQKDLTEPGFTDKLTRIA